MKSIVLRIINDFSLDNSGVATQITYNNQTRDSFVATELKDVAEYYDAMKLWEELLNHKNSVFEMKLKDGEY